ncbi:hypothetical protein AB1484_14290, partial [Parafrankia sp. FMc6]
LRLLGHDPHDGPSTRPPHPRPALDGQDNQRKLKTIKIQDRYLRAPRSRCAAEKPSRHQGSRRRACPSNSRSGLPRLGEERVEALWRSPFPDVDDLDAALEAWTLKPGEEVPEAWRPLAAEGVLTPPPLDVDGYRECLQSCRERHPDLRILSGIELGEPHWHTSHAEALLGRGAFERVLASVHACAVFVWEIVCED